MSSEPNQALIQVFKMSCHQQNTILWQMCKSYWWDAVWDFWLCQIIMDISNTENYEVVAHCFKHIFKIYW